MTRYVTLGEIMLRLKAPGHERLLQSPTLEASFGGGEANVAVALARLGLNVSFVTALPDNAIGDAAVGELRRHGIDVSHVIRRGRRVGLYYLEAGSNQRPSKVVYDRAGSAIAEADASAFDWEAIFAGAGWFHITGITPALSEKAAALSLEACRQARARGLTVSCDLNHRAKLWTYGKSAPEVMTELFELVDVGIGGREDCRRSLGIGADAKIDAAAGSPGGALELSRYEALTSRVLASFPNLSVVAITLREAENADRNGFSACLRDRERFVVARRHELTDIVDRVGAGDAFAAGLIYGLNRYEHRLQALEFATAAGCLKHTIPGDFNRIGVAEIEQLMTGGGSGRVER
jgi:2-dehydro-3-deoxygluconokinase